MVTSVDVGKDVDIILILENEYAASEVRTSQPCSLSFSERFGTQEWAIPGTWKALQVQPELPVRILALGVGAAH